MNQYITGQIIKKYRKNNNITQQKLADALNVSSKTISKWETGKGFPDVSILERLSKALGISIYELLSGECIVNKNIHSNIMLTGFYVCPICNNIISATGDALISCHGINLVKEQADEKQINMQLIEDEVYFILDSSMTKKDYVSFVSGIYNNGITIIKLYPEQSPEIRLKRRGLRKIYFYDIKEGLFYSKVNIIKN